MEQQRQSGLPRNELRDELLAVTQARKELSHDDEVYLIENFLGRLDSEIDTRIERKLADRPARRPRSDPARIVLPVLGISVPLTALAGIFVGLPGLIVVWVAIVLVVAAGTYERPG